MGSRIRGCKHDFPPGAAGCPECIRDRLRADIDPVLRAALVLDSEWWNEALVGDEMPLEVAMLHDALAASAEAQRVKKEMARD